MLLIDRTTEALTVTECDLRALIRDFPRTSPRPTDQRSGELTGDALDAFTAPTIEDEDIDVTSLLDHFPTPLIPNSPLIMKGLATMHIKQFHQGGCLLHVFATDLALLAVVLRHATSSEHLLDLTPLMSTTLEGLATAFETGTLVALQQTGHLRVEGDAMLTAEQVQAWCQRVVVEGVDGTSVPVYATNTPVSSTSQVQTEE